MLSYFYSFNVTAAALSQMLTTTDKSVKLKSDCFIYFCFVKGWEQVHLLHVPPRDDGHEGRYEPPPNPQPQVQILKYMYSSTYMYMVWKKTKCSDRKLWQTDQQTDGHEGSLGSYTSNKHVFKTWLCGFILQCVWRENTKVDSMMLILMKGEEAGYRGCSRATKTWSPISVSDPYFFGGSGQKSSCGSWSEILITTNTAACVQAIRCAWDREPRGHPRELRPGPPGQALHLPRPRCQANRLTSDINTYFLGKHRITSHMV